jgi:large subunit ribosomal protein L18
MTIIHNQSNQQRRSRRVHTRVKATGERPKLVITRSNQAIYLQVVNQEGKVVFAASDLSLAKAGQLKKGLTKTQRAAEVGKTLGALLVKAEIKTISVDRGSYKYHGRLKAAVEAIKETGVEI